MTSCVGIGVGVMVGEGVGGVAGDGELVGLLFSHLGVELDASSPAQTAAEVVELNATSQTVQVLTSQEDQKKPNDNSRANASGVHHLLSHVDVPGMPS